MGTVGRVVNMWRAGYRHGSISRTLKISPQQVEHIVVKHIPAVARDRERQKYTAPNVQFRRPRRQ